MDLLCRNKYDGAFYHVLNDCIVPNICTIEKLNNDNAPACYDSWQSRWIQMLAPHSKKSENARRDILITTPVSSIPL